MAQAPCKDCEKRHFKCHSDCIDYALFKKEHEDEKKDLSKYAELNEVRKDRQTKEMKYRKGRYK